MFEEIARSGRRSALFKIARRRAQAETDGSDPFHLDTGIADGACVNGNVETLFDEILSLGIHFAEREVCEYLRKPSRCGPASRR
jgi:hypothetical protein